jgi:hypothetical protein
MQDFIKNNYTEEELAQILVQPKSKMDSLVDLIEKIKENN